jgi:hypothetical protein
MFDTFYFSSSSSTCPPSPSPRIKRTYVEVAEECGGWGSVVGVQSKVIFFGGGNFFFFFFLAEVL